MSNGLPDALTLAAFVSAVMFGQALLSASVLASRVRYRQVYLPLAICFLAMSVTALGSIMDSPALQILPRPMIHLITAASFPTDPLLLPMFWFYVRALTTEHEQDWSKRDLIHLIPTVIGFIIFVIVLFTPDADRTALFDTGRDTSSLLQTGLFFLILGLYVVWLCQWIFYALAILKRLVTYRTRLKDLFASTSHLELGWIGWLGLLILVDWAWVITIFGLELFTDIKAVEEPWLSLLDLALIWTLSVWGLRQKPGLATEVAKTHKVEDTNPHNDGSQYDNHQSDVPRYEKSALDADQIERLAQKIKTAMEKDQLYRDPDLSLSGLAKHIGARPNYVSQTLNARLASTFFDYVNQWRVKDAQAQLASSSATVLTIAFDVGFNTRSSFYAAFKRYVGATPSAWRNAQNNPESA